MFIHRFKDGVTIIFPEDPSVSVKSSMLLGYIQENKDEGEGILFGRDDDLLQILIANIEQLHDTFGPEGKRLLAITLARTLEKVAEGADGIDVISISKVIKEGDDGEGDNQPGDV